MDYIAGIDGGGTGTTLLCRTASGQPLGEETFGPFNINGTSPTAFSALLDQIAGSLRTRGRCLALCIGAAGVSNPALHGLVAQAMERAGVVHWQLSGDHEIALAGALEGRPGCALIAGTGSVCLGSDGRGNTIRAGGWGHLIGDEGSGYALGRDALAAVARSMDGRDETTALAAMVEEQFALTSRETLVAYVYGGDKSRLAALAPLVEQAAAAGDGTAGHIIAVNAAALATLAASVAKRTGLGAGEIAMMGGLLTHDTLLRRETVSALARFLPGWSCIPPRHSAAEGAVLIAQQLL